MAERVILCICLLLTPLLVWGAGMLLKRTPPGRPNGVYGYRTRRSGKSQAAWEFAQKKSAEVMTRCGRWMLLLSLAADAPLVDILYETASATATVGLTRGLTPHLSLWGKLIIIATMYFGRIGPISLAIALGTRKEEQNRVSDPIEEISVG